VSNSWIQNPNPPYNLIPREEYNAFKYGDKREAAFVRGDIQEFVSPIDGTIISSQKGYRDHCKKHRVVSFNEFDAGHFERAGKHRTAELNGMLPEQRRERAEDLKRSIHILQYGNRGRLPGGNR
jgi:hypothetical protein